jgi:hypothetical protein
MHLYNISEKVVINSDIRLLQVREHQGRHTKHNLVSLFIHSFSQSVISGLFHDAVGISHCVASNGD